MAGPAAGGSDEIQRGPGSGGFPGLLRDEAVRDGRGLLRYHRGMEFDPNAAAAPGSGVFGLPFGRSEARLVLAPVPFDATASYGGGSSGAPEAIRSASAQVDLLDHQFGRVYERGIFMEEMDDGLVESSALARRLAAPIISRGGADEGDAEAIRRIDASCVRMNEFVRGRVAAILAQGRIPGVVGGDHSTPFGAIEACAESVAKESGGGGMGVLQIDAHMDLRRAYEGFAWSHASIMWNVLERIAGVSRLVQVGIRDYCEEEREYGRGAGARVAAHFDYDWRVRMSEGARLRELCREAIDPLPGSVYVSFDIDGLDPSLCPHTGTPVPGGLGFNEAAALLGALAESGRRIVGFDLNEVCPGREGDEWDANVGARVLYKLCGAALRSG